ncbi:oligosaccharide flippase family protein [Vibrio breoganii]
MKEQEEISNNEKKSLLSNFFSLSLLQLASYVLPLLTLPYLVNTLGKEVFGIVMFAQVVIVFFDTFIDFGFNLSATREISVNRGDKHKVTEIFSSVITIKLMLLLLCFFILLVLISFIDSMKSEWELYILSFLPTIGNALFPVWYFQGMERMKFVAIVNIASKVIFTLLIFALVRKPDDYLIVPVITSLGSITGALCSIYILRKVFLQKYKKQSYQTIKFYVKEGYQFLLSRLSSVGYSNANTFLVGVILQPQFVTYYYLADKAVNICLTLFNPVVQSIYPYLSKKFNFNFFFKLIALTVICSFLIVSIIYLFSEKISLFLLKENIDVFIACLQSLSILIPISMIYVMFGAPLLLARGYKKEFNKSIIYGFVIHAVILIGLYCSYLLNWIEGGERVLLFFSLSLVLSKTIVLALRFYYIYKFKVYKRQA